MYEPFDSVFPHYCMDSWKVAYAAFFFEGTPQEESAVRLLP